MIIEQEGEFSIEDLIADEDVAVTVTDTGYIKRTPITTYREQRRGGKGRIGMRTREEDMVNHLFVASTHSYLMVFSDRGRAYWLKVHEIPDVGADGRGKSIANLVQMESGEKIADMLAVREFDDTHFIMMGTRNGTIKKTELSAFSNPRAGGIIAMGIEEDDAVMSRAAVGRRSPRCSSAPRGQGHPLPGGGSALDGPDGVRGPRHPAARGRRSGGHAGRQARRAPPHRHRAGYAKQTKLVEYRVTGSRRTRAQEHRDHRQERAGREHRAAAQDTGAAGHHRTGQDPAHAGQ